LSFLVELPLDAYAGRRFEGFVPEAGFSPGTARAMMWMAQLAYEVRHAQAKIGPVLQRWDLRPVALLADGARHSLDLAGTRGIVAQGRGAVIVAFAGTDPMAFANWITNFNVGARLHGLHKGFEAAVAAIRDDLLAALRTCDPALPLFIAGHSLGGALAVIAAERLKREESIAARAVYSFGAPRVGSRSFAHDYIAAGLAERTFRLVHGLDIVPSLPPSALGFHHAGRMIACGRGEHFTAHLPVSDCDCDEPLFFDTLRRGVQQRLHDIRMGSYLPSARPGLIGAYQTYMLPPPFTDHLPERYRRAVEPAG
jgi:pimeloyl-ACP methyl ester carboxylesterase